MDTTTRERMEHYDRAEAETLRVWFQSTRPEVVRFFDLPTQAQSTKCKIDQAIAAGYDQNPEAVY